MVRKIILYFYLCNCYFQWSSFQFIDVYFSLVPFSFSLKDFNISCSVGLLMVSSFIFSVFEKAFILTFIFGKLCLLDIEF